jgi:hypothetical protein
MLVASWLLLAMSSTSAGDVPSQQPALQISDDGASILDRQARQVWSRCLEGTQWDGRVCSGSPRMVTHAQALALARARSRQEGQRWRLPRVKELQALSRKAAHATGSSPSILPPVPGGWLWTDSATIDTRPINPYNYNNIQRGIDPQNANSVAFLHGWTVHQDTAEARGDTPKRTRLPVRLVRAAP